MALGSAVQIPKHRWYLSSQSSCSCSWSLSLALSFWPKRIQSIV